MILIQDLRLRQKYHGFSRLTSDITEITIHGSGGGQSSNDLINWMASNTCERIPFYLKGIGLFPFTINYDGKIYQLMPVGDWYYHSDCGQHDSHTIGIEMMNSGEGNSGKYTIEQHIALEELISDLLVGYPTITEIRSHDANRREFSEIPSKPCPGINFKWGDLEQYITDNVTDRTMTITRG
jgi:hypothetical protein